MSVSDSDSKYHLRRQPQLQPNQQNNLSLPKLLTLCCSSRPNSTANTTQSYLITTTTPSKNSITKTIRYNNIRNRDQEERDAIILTIVGFMFYSLCFLIVYHHYYFK